MLRTAAAIWPPPWSSNGGEQNGGEHGTQHNVALIHECPASGPSAENCACVQPVAVTDDARRSIDRRAPDFLLSRARSRLGPVHARHGREANARAEGVAGSALPSTPSVPTTHGTQHSRPDPSCRSRQTVAGRLV